MVAYHRRTQRFAVLVCHRDYGKTWAVLNDLVVRCLAAKGLKPHFFYVAPYRVQAKAVAWNWLKYFAEKVPGYEHNESDLTVSFNGDRQITLYGADNFNALRGLHFDGGVIDESELIPKEAVDYVLDYCLKTDAWCTEIGTIKGSKGLYKKWDLVRNDPSYFTCYLDAEKSGVKPQYELDRLKKKNPVAYAREMMLDPNAEISGSIYGKQMSELRAANRIREFQADHSWPMYTFWDLGQSDYTCIWLVQVAGRDKLALDYYCNHGYMASHYAQKILEWEAKYGKISLHFLPHDARNKAGGGFSWLENLEQQGLANIEVVQRIPNSWTSIFYRETPFAICVLNQPASFLHLQ